MPRKKQNIIIAGEGNSVPGSVSIGDIIQLNDGSKGMVRRGTVFVATREDPTWRITKNQLIAL